MLGSSVLRGRMERARQTCRTDRRSRARLPGAPPARQRARSGPLCGCRSPLPGGERASGAFKTHRARLLPAPLLTSVRRNARCWAHCFAARLRLCRAAPCLSRAVSGSAASPAGLSLDVHPPAAWRLRRASGMVCQGARCSWRTISRPRREFDRRRLCPPPPPPAWPGRRRSRSSPPSSSSTPSSHPSPSSCRTCAKASSFPSARCAAHSAAPPARALPPNSADTPCQSTVTTQYTPGLKAAIKLRLSAGTSCDLPHRRVCKPRGGRASTAGGAGAGRARMRTRRRGRPPRHARAAHRGTLRGEHAGSRGACPNGIQ